MNNFNEKPKSKDDQFIEQNFEFVEYTQIADDKYMQGIATVRFMGFIELAYALRPSKDGGVFYAMASHSYNLHGEKKYVEGAKIDSSSKHRALQEFLRKNVHLVASGRSSTQATSSYPNQTIGAPIQSQAQNFANGGGATEAELPF